MNFTAKFKIIWWVSQLIFFGLFLLVRAYLGHIGTLDTYVFILFSILLILPLVSEISVYGVSVKKEIENAKQELKASIAEIKNNFQPVINIDARPATKKERQKKIEEDVILDEIVSSGQQKNPEEIKEGVYALVNVEEQARIYFQKKYGENYRPAVAVKNNLANKKLILDGVVLKDGKIDRVVEIKVVRKHSLERLKYSLMAFFDQLSDYGLNARIVLVLVSDNMDDDFADDLRNEISIAERKTKYRILVDTLYFKWEKGSLIEVEEPIATKHY